MPLLNTRELPKPVTNWYGKGNLPHPLRDWGRFIHHLEVTMAKLHGGLNSSSGNNSSSHGIESPKQAFDTADYVRECLGGKGSCTSEAVVSMIARLEAYDQDTDGQYSPRLLKAAGGPSAEGWAELKQQATNTLEPEHISGLSLAFASTEDTRLGAEVLHT